MGKYNFTGETTAFPRLIMSAILLEFQISTMKPIKLTMFALNVEMSLQPMSWKQLLWMNMKVLWSPALDLNSPTISRATGKLNFNVKLKTESMTSLWKEPMTNTVNTIINFISMIMDVWDAKLDTKERTSVGLRINVRATMDSKIVLNVFLPSIWKVESVFWKTLHWSQWLPLFSTTVTNTHLIKTDATCAKALIGWISKTMVRLYAS